MLFLIFIILIQIGPLACKTLDNRLIGTPTVSCGPNALRISAESEDIFEGQVFIKNQRKSPDCFLLFTSDDNTTTPYFSLALSQISSCGLEMRRNADAKGLELFAVMIFAFHPSFVTAGDRAFAVHCLFQQQQYTVATKFDFIEDLSTSRVIGSTTEMPSVSLTIVPGRIPTVDSVKESVQVGQPLMLVWHLASSSQLYGVRVLDCLAQTRDGKGMHILKRGCSTDKSLVSHVRYADHFERAFSDATAFKFPDLEEVWFKCSVQLCIKRFEHLILSGKSEEDLCNEDEPRCDEPSLDRRRRHDIEDSTTYSDDIFIVNGRIRVEHDTEEKMAEKQVSNFDSPSMTCMKKEAFAIGTAISVTIYTITIATILIIAYLRICKNKSYTV